MPESFEQLVEWNRKFVLRRGLRRAIRKANWHAYDRKRDKYDFWVKVACNYAARLGLESITVEERWLP